MRVEKFQKQFSVGLSEHKIDIDWNYYSSRINLQITVYILVYKIT